mmetsp:Transcript_15563/g.19579  ORF Transcript_15563/g.19579 Transcript_15563/m.19579 type:complete len:101 (-) Transcript_15563:150-452(-)
MYTEQRSFCSEGSFIDEAGCFISMMDETKRKANIFVIDWTYKVDKPPEKKRRLSSVSSIESGGPNRDMERWKETANNSQAKKNNSNFKRYSEDHFKEVRK